MELTTATATATSAIHSRALLHSCAQTSYLFPFNRKCKTRFYEGSVVTLSSVVSPASRLKPITTTSSLADETVATTKVAEVDSSLDVKKKAADLCSDLKGTSIFLVGTKSSMKTNLGKLLADAFRYYYFDSDSVIEEAAGGELAAKSLKESDEKAFRASETEVLKQLSSMGRLVVCAGDGAVQSSTNLALLRHGISFWIDVPLDMVAKEMAEDQNQIPEPDSEVLNQLIDAYEDNREGYATADVRISLQSIAAQLGYDAFDSVTPEDMALQVLKEMEKMIRVKKMMEEAAKPF